jgi:cytochrome c peroxidase
VFVGALCLAVSFTACKEEVPPNVVVQQPQDVYSVLFDVHPDFPPVDIPEDNPVTWEGFELGRHLFYDSILSIDNTVSCGSCHSLKSAFVDNEKVSEGVMKRTGTRNAMPIFNLMWKNQLFWDGRANSLAHLATMPITNELEMAETIPGILSKLNGHPVYPEKFKEVFDTDSITEDEVSKALEQFLIALISDDSRFDRFNLGKESLTDQELRGFEVATQKGCFNCHSTTLFHDNDFHVTGLEFVSKDPGRHDVTKNSTDHGKMGTPSLRNVELTAPYMHDGRFNTLLEVINFYDNDVVRNAQNISPEMEVGLRSKLTPADKEALIAFLKTLTDQTFINNERFSDPFKKSN